MAIQDKKYEKPKYTLKERFEEPIAPGHSNELATVLSDEEVSNNESLPTEWKDMISIYNRSGKAGKIVILPLLSADHRK